MGTKRRDITEMVFDTMSKAVAAKDVATTIEHWEGEIRDYTNHIGCEVENPLKVLQLKRMLPKVIRWMIHTVGLANYKEAKEYALKQARALKHKKGP